MPKSVRLLFRVGVSLGMLTILLASVDARGLIQAIRQIHWATLSGCLLAILAGVGLSSYKWQGFLLASGIRVELGKLVQLYFISIFFSNFLPTSVGGDLVRTGLLYKDRAPPANVIASVLAERLAGLSIVCFFGAGGLLFLPALGEPIRFPLLVLGAMTAGAGALFCVNLFRHKLTSVLSVRLGDVVERFISCMAAYLRHPGILVRAVWTSVVFQLLVGVTYFLVAKDLSVEVDFGPILVVVSLVTLLTLLPVSLNGIGLREGGFVFLLGRLGVDKLTALALSLTVYALVLGVSLLGGIAFILWRRQERATTAESL